MSIHFSREMGIFALETEHSSYRIKIGSYGYLLHLYYGAKVALEDNLSLMAYPLERSFSGNPNESGYDRSFTIDTLPQEYSMFGSGDYRSACLISVNPDGTREADLRYVSHTIENGARLLRDFLMYMTMGERQKPYKFVWKILLLNWP